MTASSAFKALTSVTITFAPNPRARLATPLPHHPYPATTTVVPAINRFVALIIPSNVLCPVPYRLSKKCFVRASFTAIIGYLRTPSAAMLLRRITPVVVSSVPATTCSTKAGFASSEWSLETRSAPSSIVIVGCKSSAASMCL